jgi:hypothetical protein
MGYNGHATSPYEPDWDAPWNYRFGALPNNARCGTCRHWAGQCLNHFGRCFSPENDGEVKRAEDRCMAWQQARGEEMRINEAIAFWESRSVLANSR